MKFHHCAAEFHPLNSDAYRKPIYAAWRPFVRPQDRAFYAVLFYTLAMKHCPSARIAGRFQLRRFGTEPTTPSRPRTPAAGGYCTCGTQGVCRGMYNYRCLAGATAKPTICIAQPFPPGTRNYDAFGFWRRRFLPHLPGAGALILSLYLNAIPWQAVIVLG